MTISSDLTDRLVELIREVAQVRTLQLDRSCSYNGVDSLVLVEWLFVVEQEFGVELTAGEGPQAWGDDLPMADVIGSVGQTVAKSLGP